MFFAYSCHDSYTPYSSSETPSHDEMEAYKVLQKCLELRERYIFREEVAPWEKEIITDPSTPKPNPNPFNYVHQAKTEVSAVLYI